MRAQTPKSNIMGNKSAKKAADKPKHPIGAAIESFDHAVRDIEASARLFVPYSVRHLQERHQKAFADVDDAIKEAKSAKKQVRVTAFAKLDEAFSRIDRLEKTNIPWRLEQCLFIGLFSVFDAFIGDFVGIIFSKKPELFECIKRDINCTEISGYSSIESLKRKIIDDYIEDLRRKSYVDQFIQLENLFSIPLRKFEDWPAFIEAAQRRNLLTHCDGTVSEQYLKVCKDVGYNFNGDRPKIGTKLTVGAKYFLNASLLVQEVGIKLAHTLWRKLFESELETADQHLSELIYEYLVNAKLPAAVCLGEFAYSQKKISNEQWKLVISVNYCIALLQSGAHEKCGQIINAFDLSSALPEFRLAKAVLTRNFSEAARVMRLIGKEGEFINEMNYRIWPLFKEFRSTPEFQKAYKEIYRYDYLLEVKKVAAEKKHETPEIKSLGAAPNTSRS